jgi:hypothetical protein
MTWLSRLTVMSPKLGAALQMPADLPLRRPKRRSGETGTFRPWPHHGVIDQNIAAAHRFSVAHQTLANLRFSCCNLRHNRIWPFDCEFRDLEV